ncbi:YSIRK-type signal peptide-containing protein [Aerococcus sp. JJEM-2022c]|uniref:YSIRK-type signal peptide-containing protein n=1 Tax=Aerococcus sp. Group 2 TaxID=2976811 RepID=UPI00227C18C2|nr:YSIRK-type signal peptide-containing protein [Aerococcus sp. Group 2]MCY3041629.1 YSIRK-type signal peptide-containing protein [Aerococcus sp. Group 2]
MLSKNNQHEQIRKRSQRNYHYAIKNLKIGVFSVAVSVGLSFLGQGAIVQAQNSKLLTRYQVLLLLSMRMQKKIKIVQYNLKLFTLKRLLLIHKQAASQLRFSQKR